MLNPFDNPTAAQFEDERFSGRGRKQQADVYEMLDAGLGAKSQVSAARRAEKYRKARQKEAWAREDEVMSRQLRAQRNAQRSAGRTSLIGAGIGAAGGIIAAI